MTGYWACTGIAPDLLNFKIRMLKHSYTPNYITVLTQSWRKKLNSARRKLTSDWGIVVTLGCYWKEEKVGVLVLAQRK